MSETTVSMTSVAKRKKRSLSRQLLNWLGSMTLAITLLVVLGLASVIGTILEQNLPYNTYLMKFGPFWFEVFDALRLYDVYSAGWFIVILVFLVLSTTICVWRNAPTMLRDIRNFRTGVQEKSLRGFKHSAEWTSAKTPEDLVGQVQATLSQIGYRSQVKQEGDHLLVAAKKGGLNRWGYILTHVGLVVILIGGLMDSKVRLHLKHLFGDLVIETRDLPVSQIGPESRVGVENSSFRGNVNIPEGLQADVVFLNLRDGYVVQELPFDIRVNQFRIEYYDTGAPKAYESDLTIIDHDTGESFDYTIGVNYPLFYRGYGIYQSSYSDGGSKLNLKAWHLDGQVGSVEEIQSAVFQTVPFVFQGEQFQLEFLDFQPLNINQVEGENGEIEQRDFGPSIVFNLRDETGQAIEYENYMLPVLMNGYHYFLSGIRTQIGGPQQFLFIPADRNGKIDTFMSLMAKLHDEQVVKRVAGELLAAMQVGQGNPISADQVSDTARESIVKLVRTFVNDGFAAVEADIRESFSQHANMSLAQQEQVVQASLRVLQTVISRIFDEVLMEQGFEEQVEDDLRFLEEALIAISVIPLYRSPIYLQLTDFEHIQASGLQIAKSPGKPVVYFGSIMMTIGIFMLFYIHYRRQWVWLRREEQGSRVLLAGMDGRNNMDFDREFVALKKALRRTSGLLETEQKMS
ncbi:MAG TPA: cytochrome c biogenesis protein ResB [Halothiobacillus sp.]|nr:cytochrome c biogenesis protein ResB [Halothiobacillus sp.]